MKKKQKIMKKQCFPALCPNASTTIKVVPISSKDVNAFYVLLSICPFTAYAVPLFFRAYAFCISLFNIVSTNDRGVNFEFN